MQSRKFDERYEDFIDKFDKFNRVNDKHQTSQETLNDRIQSVRADITALDEALKNLQINADEELAKKMQTSSSKTNFDALDLRVQSLENLEQQFTAQLENLEEHFTVQLDSLEQYNRQYIVNFLKIANQGTRNRPENVTDLVINFLSKRLGIKITNRDISICHRQDIPSERMRLGRKYIAPIYCKFLHRTLVHEILGRKHLLRRTRNKFNEPYEVTQNLTLNRRLLWSAVQEKLGNFRFKWVKRGGDICVKKNANSKVIKVTCERVLDELVSQGPDPKSSTPSVENGPPQGHANASSGRNRYADVAGVDCALITPHRSNPDNVSLHSRLLSNSTNAVISTFRKTSLVNFKSSAF